MYKTEVEIYSDKTNSAVMKHPGRNYPGTLIQGDSLYALCKDLDEAIRDLDSGDLNESRGSINEVRNRLWSHLSHYKATLIDHGIDIPFSEQWSPQ